MSEDIKRLQLGFSESWKAAYLNQRKLITAENITKCILHFMDLHTQKNPSLASETGGVIFNPSPEEMSM